MPSIPKPLSLSSLAVFAQNSIYEEEDQQLGKVKNRENTKFWSDLVETILSLGVNLWCDEDGSRDLPQLIIRSIKPLSSAANLSKGITLYFHSELLLLWHELDIVSDLEEMQADEISATLEQYPTSFYWQKSPWYTLPLLQCRTLYHFVETLLGSFYHRLCLDISLRLCREWTLLHLPAAEMHLNAALTSEIKLQCETASVSALSLALRKSQSARAGVVLVRHLQDEKLKFLDSCEFRPLKSRALQALRKAPILKRLPILSLVYLAIWPIRQIFKGSLQLLLTLRQRLLSRLAGRETGPTRLATAYQVSTNSSPTEVIHRAICSDPTGVIHTLARSTPPSQSSHSSPVSRKHHGKEPVSHIKSSPLSCRSAHSNSLSSPLATTPSSVLVTTPSSALANLESISPQRMSASQSPERHCQTTKST